MTGSETAAELALAERDQALERARAAERALADAEAALRRRSMEVAALTRETALASARETAPRTAVETARKRPSPSLCRTRAHTLDLSPVLLYVLASARSWRNW